MRDAAVEDIDRFIGAVECRELGCKPFDRIAGHPSKLMLCTEEPFVVERLPQHEAVEEIIAVQLHAASELANILTPCEPIELTGVDRALLQIERQCLAARGDQRTVRAADLRERLPEIVPRPLIARLAP